MAERQVDGLQDTLEAHLTAVPPDQKSKLSFHDAFALLVGLQVGSGIFSSPSQVDRNTAAPGFAILVWLTSGSLAWAGATCYAELGTALPVNGGMQEYLRLIYGDGLAAMASWIWIVAVKPCSMAVLSIIFAQYWIDVVMDVSAGGTDWRSKALALLSFYTMVVFNLVGTHATARLMRLFLFIKLSTLLLLLVLTILHVVFGLHQAGDIASRDGLTRNWFEVSNPNWRPGFWNVCGRAAIAIYAGLWAFAGWDNANMVAGDMADPPRDLPRALHAAQPIVISVFVVANLCYYLVVPWTEIDRTDTIAVLVGKKIYGWPAEVLFAVLVSLACLGSLNVNIFTTGRLIVSAAQAKWLPSTLEEYRPVFTAFRKSSNKQRRPGSINRQSANEVPARAMLAMSLVTTIYILLGNFASLVTFIGLAEYAFFCATVAGVLVLRHQQPALPRPYRPHAAVPVVFTAASFLLVVFGTVHAPVQAVSLVGLIGIGLTWRHVKVGAAWRAVARSAWEYRTTSRARYQAVAADARADTLGRDA